MRDKMNIDYSALPEHMRAGTRAYIERGVIGGSFLTSVFANDFVGAYCCADDINRKALNTWAKWLQTANIPQNCWGSTHNVNQWAAHTGMEGPWKKTS